ncbi:MAG: response regulator [Clostridia bacterium]|nr:response regulator [Clostridia bacterium]
MYKVMIVDDEPMIRKGIRTMVNWEEHQCQVVCEAFDGVEGVEKIRELKPEIIITDIRMPEMDGLTMIKEVKDIIPNSKIIILTGFRDFDYVYEAMRLGAFGFILKPSKISELNSLISRAVTELRFENDRDEEINKLRALFEKNVPVLREKLLYELMYGVTDSTGDIEARMKLFGIEIKHFVMIVVSCEAGDELKALSPYDRHVYQFGIIKSVEEVFSGAFKVLSISLKELDSVFILSINDKNQLDSVIYEKCVNLQEMVGRCFNITLTISVSTEGSSSSDIQYKYQECLEALEYKHYAGNGSIIQYGDLNAFFRYDAYSQLQSVQQAILESIKAGNEENVKDKFAELEDYLTKNKSGLAWLKNYVKTFLFEVNNIRNSVLALENEKSEEGSVSLDGLYKLVDDANDPKALTELMREASLRITGRINRFNTKSIKLIVKKAVEYIRENYKEPLTLNDVAAHVYVSPSYVSRMFGRELGKNFVDYLNEVRIEKAKELLNDIRYKTYEIADRVGIQDARYFSRLFKKYTGLTPTEFREGLS